MIKTASAVEKSDLDSDSSEDEYAEFVNTVKINPRFLDDLIDLLPEQHSVYSGRTTNRINRMRGFALAAFESTGLPEAALPYALETLESGNHPYSVAGAARAIRGLRRPSPQIAVFLVKAIFNVWRRDQPISFESYRIVWPLQEYSTAVLDILETLVRLGGSANLALKDLEILSTDYRDEFDDITLAKIDEAVAVICDGSTNIRYKCCQEPLISAKDSSASFDGNSICAILEDQDENLIEWKDYFRVKHTVLAFFYTRCDNPKKCTLTIQTLVKTKKILVDMGLADKVRIAAISYDAAYDKGRVLKAYGKARRFTFSTDQKMFRVCDGFDHILDMLNLGVNYRGGVVNHHRIEYFILNPDGEVYDTFVRLKTGAEDLADAVTAGVIVKSGV